MPTPSSTLGTRISWPTDGTTTLWPFSFTGGYLLSEHVKAQTVDAVTGAVVPRAAVLQDAGTVKLDPALPAGLTLTVYRDTPRTPITDFVGGQRISEDSLDTVAKQALFVLAELADTTSSGLDLPVQAIEELSDRLGALQVSLLGYVEKLSLLATDGASLVGFDSLDDAYDTDSVGEMLVDLQGRAKGIVTLPDHLVLAPANDGADIQITLPQPLSATSSPTFSGATVGALFNTYVKAGADPGMALGPGAGTGATVVAQRFGNIVSVTLTTGTAPTGSNAITFTMGVGTNYNVPVDTTRRPIVILTPLNRNAWARQSAASTACVAEVVGPGTVEFRSGLTTALAATTEYKWSFHLVGDVVS